MALSAVRLSWKIAAADIPDLVDGLIGRTKAVYDAVGALPHNQVNYENVVKVRDKKKMTDVCASRVDIFSG